MSTNNKQQCAIWLTKPTYEKLRKLAFTSRLSQSVLVEDALNIMFKTAGQRKENNQ